MCLRIRVLDKTAVSARPYFLSLFQQDSDGSQLRVEGVLEWWDGTDWNEVPFVVGGEATPGPAFSVYLEGPSGAHTVPVIQAVRAITGLGLKEAKDLVDEAAGAVGAALVRVTASEAEACKAVDMLRIAGATSSYYTRLWP